MDEEPEEERKIPFKASWNVSGGIIQEVDRLRTLSNSNFCSGNVEQAMNHLVAIKQTTISILEDNESKELSKIQFDFVEACNNKRKCMTGFAREEGYFDAVKNINICYNKFNDALMKALQQHNLLLIGAADITGMKFRGIEGQPKK